MSFKSPLPYVEIEAYWLDEFLTLDDYDEQTQWMTNLHNSNAGQRTGGGLATYLTFLKSSVYAPRWRADNESLPPIAAWWLDPRTEPWRKHLLSYLKADGHLDTFKQKLNFISQCSVAPYPVRNASTKTMVINGSSGLNTAYPALRARHLDQTIQKMQTLYCTA